ncbi:MAG TPA: HD domain-containing protein [Steroidobacteraceae bacterium]|nr:HD domain-containing protein [Steroidobacteraceae bacterium]
MASPRRSDHDITNTVRVSSPREVLRAVEQLLVSEWPQLPLQPVERAFEDFDLLSSGRMPGYAGVDTVYHDRQHTLDVTLAMARLLVAYERQTPPAEQLGSERALLGVVLALFHDVGYLRRPSDEAQANGAEFTRTHVSRGADFLREYLPQIGMQAWAPVAAQLIHFTGYERPFDQIITHDARDTKLGHLLGTADMIAQLADRCYLEKCRDRLYPEFVLGGVALSRASGAPQVRYASGLDLLRQTPGFVAHTRATRLDGQFHRAYQYLEVLFDGQNPYIEAIERNMQYLEQVLRSESWRLLRRQPPLHAAEPDTLSRVRGLMLGYFKKTWLEE